MGFDVFAERNVLAIILVDTLFARTEFESYWYYTVGATYSYFFVGKDDPGMKLFKIRTFMNFYLMIFISLCKSLFNTVFCCSSIPLIFRQSFSWSTDVVLQVKANYLAFHFNKQLTAYV